MARPAVLVQVGESVPDQCDQCVGYLFQMGLAGVEPPLPGERDHADDHLGVHGRELGVMAARGEEVGQDVLDMPGDIAEQRAISARDRTGNCVTDLNTEVCCVVAAVPVLSYSRGLD